MPIVGSEFDPGISKDHAYVVERAAQRAADAIAERHELPERITLRLTTRPQAEDAHIDYSDWKIIVDYNALTVQKSLIELRALEGLMAHEIMHMAQKLDGTEGEIVRLFTEEFRAQGLRKDQFGMMLDLGMMVKDIVVNDSLLKEGFGEALFKYYLIDIHSRVTDNVLPFSEMATGEVERFFLSLVGLFPAYVPFLRAGEGERGGIIKSAIQRHFKDIPGEIRAGIPEVEASLLRVSLTQERIHAFVDSALRCYALLLNE